MNVPHFRNQGIRQRLRQAAEDWKNSDKTRRFKKAKTPGVSDRIQQFFILLLLLTPLIILRLGRDHGIQLALLLPVVAAFVSLFYRGNVWVFFTNQTIYHLPISDQQLAKQIRQSSHNAFIKGGLLAFLYGAASADDGSFLSWGLLAVLTYIGILSFLTLTTLPRLQKLSNYTLYVFGAASFSYLVFERFQQICTTLVIKLPWHQAFYSWTSLALFLGAGFLTAWIIRKKWLSVENWDRTHYYQNFGASMQATPSSDEIEVSDFSPKIPSQPVGIFEKHMWKKLTPKERTIFRTAGGTQSNFLRAWLITTSLVAAWAWLATLDLFPRVKIYQPALFIGFTLSYLVASTLFWKLHWMSQSFSGAVETSPRALAAVFHTIPVGILNLEKLHWKEGLYRWPLMTLTIVIGPKILFESYSLSNFIFGFLYLLPLVILAHTMMFWVARVKGWFPPLKHHGLRLQLTSFVVFIFTLITTYLATQIIFEILSTETSFNPKMLIFTTLAATLGIVLLRQLVLPYIANPRRDLMRQL
ncbi:hypothetical protein V2O64_21850 [Verrucomicrobiaceae bacterium 227]